MGSFRNLKYIETGGFPEAVRLFLCDLKILEILIQNQMFGINFTCQTYFIWISRYRRGEWHSLSHDTGKFPYCQTMAFVVYAISIFSYNLYGYFLAMGEWLKKNKCNSPLRAFKWYWCHCTGISLNNICHFLERVKVSWTMVNCQNINSTFIDQFINNSIVSLN